MNILIIGGSGFLGSRLTKLLLQEGYKVKVTYRPGDNLQLLKDLDVVCIPCDLLDAEGLRKAVQGVQAILHVAAMITFDQNLYETQMKVNVEGTRLILQAAREEGVQRFVYTGTVNVLGIPPLGSVGNENTPFNWQPWKLGYMDSKKAAEDLVMAASNQGLYALSVLPGTFFGPGDINFNAGAYIQQGSRGLLVAAPPGGTSVVHVDDVAKGHLLALTQGKKGERYILGGENMSYRDLFTMIAEELGRKPPLFTIPAQPFKTIGRAMDWLHCYTGIQFPMGEGLAIAACSLLYYSSEKAGQELGYNFRPAREAIRDAIRWYRSEGLISKRIHKK